MLAQTPAPTKSAAPPTKSAAPATKAPASNPLLHPESLKAKAPDEFKVKFATSHGDFVVDVHREWSPLGADRFYNLVRSHYFTNCAFFRVAKNQAGNPFVVQFGMSPDPNVGKVWQTASIKDDPPNPSLHNVKGKVVFATSGPNTRTTQLFVNTGDNQFLDSQGFTPFGEVVEGMDVVLGLNGQYGERPDQTRILNEGKAYLDKEFPKLDFIKSATIETAAAATPATATKSTAPAAAPKK